MQAAENQEVDGVLGEQLAVARGEEHGEELGVGQHAAEGVLFVLRFEEADEKILQVIVDARDEGEKDNGVPQGHFVLCAGYNILPCEYRVWVFDKEASKSGPLHKQQLFSRPNEPNHSLMHARKMSPVLNRIVRRKNPWGYRQDSPDIRADSHGAAHVHHHAQKGDLVQIVIQYLPEWAAIIRPSRLLTIDCINRLVPKIREPCQQPHPTRKRLSERGIQHAYSDQAGQRENQTQQGQSIWRQPVWQKVISNVRPERIVDPTL